MSSEKLNAISSFSFKIYKYLLKFVNQDGIL